MARPSSLLLWLSIFTLLHLSAASKGGDRSFIKRYCTDTKYPDLCFRSLSSYAATIRKSPRQLAHVALFVSLRKAQETKSFVSKLRRFRGLKRREYAAIKDCTEEIDETVNRLGQSLEELKRARYSKRSNVFRWRISNVVTWVSAALTNENTCSDGFAGRGMNERVKSSIGARMVNVGRLTSNALALINKFASQRRLRRLHE